MKSKQNTVQIKEIRETSPSFSTVDAPTMKWLVCSNNNVSTSALFNPIQKKTTSLSLTSLESTFTSYPRTSMKDRAAPTMHSEEAHSNDEIRYFLVWSEKTGEEPAGYKPHEFSCININVPSTHLLNQDTNLCTAAFKFRNLEANFTCHYHPATNIFSDFKLVEGTAQGGMEDIKSITISFHREVDGAKIEVADDNGKLFMFIQMEYGYEGDLPISGDIWGKKELPGGWARHVTTLSEQEREDLELDRWDEEQREALLAFLAERKRKADEQAEQVRGGAGPNEGGREAWETVEQEAGD